MTNLTVTTGDTTTFPNTSDALTGKEIAEIFFRILIYVAGVVGNVLVIFFIVFLKEFKKITHWYILQLALADLLYLQTMPFKISETVHRRWIYSEELCRARQTILWLNYYASTTLLTIIALDRYVAVCHPHSPKMQRLRTRTCSFVLTGVTWLLSIVMCIPVMMFSGLVGTKPDCTCLINFPKIKEKWCQRNFASSAEEMEYCKRTLFDQLYGGESCISSDSSSDQDNIGDGPGIPSNDAIELAISTDFGIADEAFVYFNFSVMFVMPLIVITACYGLIAKRMMSTGVWSCRKFWKPRRGSLATSSGQNNREKMRVTALCAVLVLLFIVCWLPYHSVQIADMTRMASNNSQNTDGLSNFSFVLLYVNSALNPYLYNFLGTFRKRMRQVMNDERMRSCLPCLSVSTKENSTGTSKENITMKTIVEDKSANDVE